MDAFFQILAEKIISLLEGFFRQANQAHSRQPGLRVREAGSRIQARLAHRLSAG
jgi:hypothetical protein